MIKESLNKFLDTLYLFLSSTPLNSYTKGGWNRKDWLFLTCKNFMSWGEHNLCCSEEEEEEEAKQKRQTAPSYTPTWATAFLDRERLSLPSHSPSVYTAKEKNKIKLLQGFKILSLSLSHTETKVLLHLGFEACQTNPSALANVIQVLWKRCLRQVQQCRYIKLNIIST